MNEQREQQSAADSGAAQHLTRPALDIEKLAEKVYQLMREDLRLFRARGNARETRK